MNHRTLVNAFALLAVCLVASASASDKGRVDLATSGAAEREAEVARVIHQWADARVRGDAAFLERFYAAELRIGAANGSIVERADDIALFAARRIKPEYIRNTDVAVRIYGDAAVVSCIESLKGTYRGTPGEMSLRMLNVLAYRDGRWQLVATQSAVMRVTP